MVRNLTLHGLTNSGGLEGALFQLFLQLSQRSVVDEFLTHIHSINRQPQSRRWLNVVREGVGQGSKVSYLEGMSGGHKLGV